MGSGRWDAEDWTSYSTSKSYASKPVGAIYTSRTLDPDLNPRNVTRESRDSNDNPHSTPLIVGLDVTGSMHAVLDVMAKHGLNTLVSEVYDRRPITDPHVLCAGIGDVEMGDRAPLQVTQFEADLRIAQQLEKLYLEGGGGGNSYESYALLWYFAARHTATDSYEKRNKKGYLFTIGDEEPTPYLRKEDLALVLGDTEEARRLDVNALLTEVSRKWEVFHVMVAEGNHASAHPDRVKAEWSALLGQRALWLSDHTKLAEVIVSTIQIVEGVSHDDVVGSWDGSTALVVKGATDQLARATAVGGMVSL